MKNIGFMGKSKKIKNSQNKIMKTFARRINLLY